MKLSSILCTFFLVLLSSSFAFSQEEVTYSNTIAEIIYTNCTSCHRAGEIGPMPLTNYDEVKAWGTMIQYVTEQNYMPPWPPNKEYSHFIGERGLSQDQIASIADWVDNAMPRGNIIEEPELPVFPSGSQIGDPDLVLTMEEAFVQEGNNTDNYRVFVLPTGLTEDKQVAAIELRPGNPKIVHHALFSYDTSGEAQTLDAQDPDYGYDGFGGFGIDESLFNQYPGYVPGQKPYIYPDGLGKLLPAESDLLIQMHYAPIPVAETDQSSVNIFFKDEAVERQVREFIMLPFEFTAGMEFDGPFIIQANQVKSFHGRYTVPTDVSILAISPHMHLLGQKWEVYIEHTDGSTSNLIEIPEWDFNWQGTYNFPKYIVAEAGSVVHAIATYDNTVDNPLNPNNPPQFVTWGEKTTDEMYYLPISYVFYNQGDEDVVFENTTTSAQETAYLDIGENRLLDPFPNPSSESLNIHFTLAVGQRVKVDLIDLEGRTVNTLCDNKIHQRGRHEYQMDISNVMPGNYVVTLTSDRGVAQSKQITIQ